MDRDTLIGIMEFTRQRLLGTLDAIQAAGPHANKILAWRPGRGRAHIAWQAMHCAATHDKYLNVVIKGAPAPVHPALVTDFGGGSTPSDDRIPDLANIRQTLDTTYQSFKTYLSALTPADLERQVGPPERRRTLAEAIMLMIWHEAHHQGQIHLTLNLYKAAQTA